ncbi:MAG: flagellar motor switch protein FliM [Candidatus Thiodiazotropha sp. (ex Lucina aurantia)]|uniref:Flagellar motor switch protein FliM n=2 Tax=Candidatus Thiodiazotropha TaxID=1913444 RepID=A0A7Z0VIQ4_9GAMM|nr:flagellar motor switch protein FliM [Candidatus Thiodiazotropha endolucinida]MBT3011693.1 flagellar motor switch protein FliM [Candidatus Thiodiazotropha sp. (ex Lucina pensylvanica)]MBT3025029.1 flagellar motor switch protein FliM [Candidatus Thiodiazotropha taylori]MBT3055336.1 flagellar motor switch protein FliM [Candidatus Thiodiazotropha sp. (ex Codakia orbicularis)]MBV2103886.1 flagellar motor switch protein FliM [Candidatus Thiodiazotropha sp. (ex Lucina aurantia)]MBV2098798.1 flagel
MSANDLLSQEEIDALLHGVDNGDVATETDVADAGGVNSYDFTSQDRIVRGRLPTLEMINERFARLFRTSLFNMLRRTADLSVSGIQMQKFSEFVHSLFVPTSLNMIRVPPLRGKGLFVIDPKLVFSVVDNYFGGSGRFHTKIEGRDFTPTENRVIQLLLNRAFEDLEVAWKPVFQVKFEYSGSEVNPQFANIVSPSEVVVVTSFHVDLESGGGDFHVCMPYSMLEPIRELLDAGVQSDRGERDERWERSLKEEILAAKIELSSILTEVQISVKELAELKEGDIIPIEMPEQVDVEAAEVPVFKAKLGVSDGSYALKINNWIQQNRRKGLHDYLEMERKAVQDANGE